MSFQLVLVAIDSNLESAWRSSFDGVDRVSVVVGDIVDIACDAVVSPANSFGFMDGGIDARYLDHFGPDIQLSVRRQILVHHDGELLVGAADIVPTGDDDLPFLIAAPTMRVPMKLGDSVNPYLAARAVFRLVTGGSFTSGPLAGELVADHVGTVAMPGLGTGVGGILPTVCAHQVRAAWDDVVRSAFRLPQSWSEASERHQLLYTDRPTRLQ